MTDQPPTSPGKLPWFLARDRGTVRVRWPVLLQVLASIYAIQLVILLTFSWSLGLSWSLPRLAVILIPSFYTYLLGLYLGYRRAIATNRQGSNPQFSLFMLLVSLSTACVWFALLRGDYTATLREHSIRKQLEEQALEIVGEGTVHFSGNENKVSVVVKRPSFGDADLKRLDSFLAAKLPSNCGVYFLSLEGTQVTDKGVKLLANWNQLEMLHLEKTRVSDQGLAHIERLPNLRVISAMGTGVSNEWLAKIRAARPDLNISPIQVSSGR